MAGLAACNSTVIIQDLVAFFTEFLAKFSPRKIGKYDYSNMYKLC